MIAAATPSHGLGGSSSSEPSSGYQQQGGDGGSAPPSTQQQHPPAHEQEQSQTREDELKRRLAVVRQGIQVQAAASLQALQEATAASLPPPPLPDPRHLASQAAKVQRELGALVAQRRGFKSGSSGFSRAPPSTQQKGMAQQRSSSGGGASGSNGSRSDSDVNSTGGSASSSARVASSQGSDRGPATTTAAASSSSKPERSSNGRADSGQGGGSPPAAAAAEPRLLSGRTDVQWERVLPQRPRVSHPLSSISVDIDDMDAAIAHTFPVDAASPAAPNEAAAAPLSPGAAGGKRVQQWPPRMGKHVHNVLVVSAALLNRDNQVGRWVLGSFVYAA